MKDKKSEIFIGIDKLTGAPVRFDFDPDIQMNCNVLLLGTQSAEIARLFLSRLASSCASSFFVVDLKGNYVASAKELRAEVVDPAGLDPFLLFENNKFAVADVLKRLLGLKKSRDAETISVLDGLVKECTTFADAFKMASGELKRSMERTVRGPAHLLLCGRQPELGKRVVFDLHKLNKASVPKKRVKLLSLAHLLASAKAWREAERSSPRGLKVVLLDEPQLRPDFPLSFFLLTHALRRARSRNMVLIVAFERPKTLLSSLAGRDLLDYFHVKVLAFPRISKDILEGIFATGQTFKSVRFATTDNG
jgi:hypothetical protein